MIVRVILPPRVETAFKKAAIAAFPREHAEAIRGRIVGDTVTVTRFVPIAEAKSTLNKIEYYHDDAITTGKDTDGFLGVAHSHPGKPGECDAAPSSADWKSAFECGEIVMGILVVEPRANGKFRTEFRFYESHPPIAVVHPRVRAPRQKRDLSDVPMRQFSIAVPIPLELDKKQQQIVEAVQNSTQMEPAT